MFLWPKLRMRIGKRDKNEALKGPPQGPGVPRDPMHHRFCSKPPVAFDKIGVSEKACMMREQQLNEYERMGSVHKPWAPTGAHEESSQLISVHLDKYYHS